MPRAGRRSGSEEHRSKTWCTGACANGIPLFVYAASGELRPTTVEDIADRARWRRSDCYHEAYEIYGTTRQMVLPLFTSPDVIRGFILGRPGQNFGTRELAFARRVQPLLRAADCHLGALRRPSAPDPAARLRNAAACGITARELAVLALLADGLTARTIARRLSISPHTVNRHLERIYRKLETHDRLATVTLARRLGLV